MVTVIIPIITMDDNGPSSTSFLPLGIERDWTVI